MIRDSDSYTDSDSDSYTESNSDTDYGSQEPDKKLVNIFKDFEPGIVSIERTNVFGKTLPKPMFLLEEAANALQRVVRRLNEPGTEIEGVVLKQAYAPNSESDDYFAAGDIVEIGFDGDDEQLRRLIGIFQEEGFIRIEEEDGGLYLGHKYDENVEPTRFSIPIESLLIPETREDENRGVLADELVLLANELKESLSVARPERIQEILLKLYQNRDVFDTNLDAYSRMIPLLEDVLLEIDENRPTVARGVLSILRFFLEKRLSITPPYIGKAEQLEAIFERLKRLTNSYARNASNFFVAQESVTLLQVYLGVISDLPIKKKVRSRLSDIITSFLNGELATTAKEFADILKLFRDADKDQDEWYKFSRKLSLTSNSIDNQELLSRFEDLLLLNSDFSSGSKWRTLYSLVIEIIRRLDSVKEDSFKSAVLKVINESLSSNQSIIVLKDTYSRRLPRRFIQQTILYLLMAIGCTFTVAIAKRSQELIKIIEGKIPNKDKRAFGEYHEYLKKSIQEEFTLHDKKIEE